MTDLTKITKDAQDISEYWISGNGINAMPLKLSNFHLYYRDDTTWNYWDRPFCHENYIFCLVLSGERTLTLDDDKYHFLPGDAILIPPYARQSFGGARLPFKALMASFKVADDDKSLRSIAKTKFHIKLQEQNLLRKSILCFNSWINGDTASAAEAAGYFSIMLHRFQRQLLPEINKQKFHDNDNPLCRRVIEYLTANRDHRVTLKELSKALHASGSTIRQKFKQEMKQSIGQYQLNQRLTQGRNMLRSTRMTVAEIAAQCGFESASAFLRALKRRYNKSATELRKWQS